MKAIDSEDLWRRVGLEELRQALSRVPPLIQRFEEALKALPPCNACARTALLERVHAASVPLSSAVINLAVLAKTLQDVVAVAEQTQAQLNAHAPAPCRCAGGTCTCHEE